MQKTIDKESKLMLEQGRFKKRCSCCNYKISFYAFEPDKKICKWCGTLNFKNNKAKFKHILLKKIYSREQIDYEEK